MQDKFDAIMEILDPAHFYSDRQLYIQILRGKVLQEEALESFESISSDFKVDESMLTEIENIVAVWAAEEVTLQLAEPALNEEQEEQLQEIFFAGNSWASSEALGVLQRYSDFAYME
ncbi:MAG: hypothetical protein SH856_06785 [Flavobacteriales bacterium]|nr:hypothetical protein [Flavobacteriales bacterium]